jgi:hypothetical protein
MIMSSCPILVIGKTYSTRWYYTAIGSVSHRVLSLGVELVPFSKAWRPTNASSKFRGGRKVIGAIGSRASGNPATLPTSRKMTILTSKLPLNSVEINATDFLPSALSGPRRETSPGGIQVYVRWAGGTCDVRYGGTRARLIVVQIERHNDQLCM